MTPTSTDPTPDPFTPQDGIMRVSKLNIALLVLAIGSIGAALYLSPVSTPLREQVQQELSAPAGSDAGLAAPDAPSGSTTSSATPSSRPTTSTPSPTRASVVAASLRGAAGSASSIFSRLPAVTSASSGSSGTGGSSGSSGSRVPSSPSTSPKPTPAPSTSTSPTTTAPKTKCWQFTWQQDAQAVYVQNLSDPYGLDGDPGPYDSDGLACSDLPVDPTRSASTPVGAYSPPAASAETKAALVSSRTAFYGFTQDGLPGDAAMFTDLEEQAGKAPSAVGWYQSFDDPFRGDLVQASWKRGALPMVTWMPMDGGSGTSYSLTTIINGTHDAYLRKFAGDIVRTNLPVAIRFGHEMNGNWYGWSAGRSEWNNSPDKFKQAWIHVWNIFQSVGANENAIWTWAPSRVDNLTVNGRNGNSAIADDYPGDDYVDWMGASVYLRKATTGATYDASFGKTLAALKAVSSKPIFIAETGSIETDGATDEAQLKATFIKNTLAAFAADSQIVGFLWNNNTIAQVVDGQTVSNDWRFTSNPAAASTFAEEVATSRFRTGLRSIDG